MEKLAIANNALNLLGEYSIESLDEDTRPAELINEYFDSTWEEVLNEYIWSDALAYADLAKLVETPVNEYSYAYQLPTDCIRVIEINNDSDVTPTDNYILQGNKILTDMDSVTVKYIRRIDPTTADPQLTKVFYKSLAVKIAMPLVKSASIRSALFNELLQIDIPKAKFLNSIEQKPRKKLVRSRWLAGRFRGHISKGYTYERG